MMKYEIIRVDVKTGAFDVKMMGGEDEYDVMVIYFGGNNLDDYEYYRTYLEEYMEESKYGWYLREKDKIYIVRQK